MSHKTRLTLKRLAQEKHENDENTIENQDVTPAATVSPGDCASNAL